MNLASLTWSQEKGVSLSCKGLSLTIPHPKALLADGNQIDLSASEEISQILKASSSEMTYRYSTGCRMFIAKWSLQLRSSNRLLSQLTLFPEDGKPWSLRETSEGSFQVIGWQDANTLKIFHGDNIRGVSQDVSLTSGTYFIPVSQWLRPLNAGRWQSFPGLWLHEPATEMGVVTGVLSQNIWKHTLAKESVCTTEIALKGRMIPPGLGYRTYASGEAYKGEELYFGVVEANRPGTAFQSYLSSLKERIQPRFPQSTLARGPFWGSWNDRQPHFWDVDMSLIRRTIEILKARFPSVRSVQIDDGYAFGGYHEVAADRWTLIEEGLDPLEVGKMIKRVRRLGSGFAGEADNAIARDRFPNGMEEAANLIRAAGYQPAIWMGLDIVRNAKVIKDHPEWFIACVEQPDSDPELLSVFGENAENRSYVLDPSLPEVQNYIERALAILFREWKFESFKLDFWSYAFENDGFRFRNTGKTAFELRQWLFTTVRSYLPNNSYLVVACDISTGNPFLGKWVDAVRYGLDIGNGKWENFRYSSLTATFLLHVGAQHFYFLDSDSIGLLKKLPTTERQCVWAWSVVTRSLCEIAGDLAKAESSDLDDLQKLFLISNNCAEVVFGETDHLSKDEPASIIFSPGNLFSKKEVDRNMLPEGIIGVFNWSDEPRQIHVDLSNLELDPLNEYWDADILNASIPLRRVHTWQLSLPPRSVRLSHLIRIDNNPKVLDSDWALEKVQLNGKSLKIHLYGNSSRGFLIAWPNKPKLTIVKTNISSRAMKVAPCIHKVEPISQKNQPNHWLIELE